MDGRAWIEELPAPLERHARLLRRLLDAVEPDARFAALELQCSLARGAGDELSDLDLGLWLVEETSAEAAAALPELLRGLGPLVDLLVSELHGEAYVVAEYEDGVQVDLWAPRAGPARGRAPGAVVLFDRAGLLAEPYVPTAYRPGPDDVRAWAFGAWLDLSNVAKYLRRGSLWEARASLEAARAHAFRLHAARLGIAYPAFGLTSLLDEPEPSLPDGVERTVAGLDVDDLRRAARELAALLEGYEQPALARAVRRRL